CKSRGAQAEECAEYAGAGCDCSCSQGAEAPETEDKEGSQNCRKRKRDRVPRGEARFCYCLALQTEGETTGFKNLANPGDSAFLVGVLQEDNADARVSPGVTGSAGTTAVVAHENRLTGDSLEVGKLIHCLD